MDRSCRACHKSLPANATVRRAFCDDACRAAWHAERRSNANNALAPTLRNESLQTPTERQLRKRKQPAQPSVSRVSCVAVDAARIPIAMQAQLATQAPDTAIGYRLVFPLRANEEQPRFSPPIDIDGTLRSYRLNPFQAPNDVRLVEGVRYRVIWTGQSGETIPPKHEGALPYLQFHLGELASLPQNGEMKPEKESPAETIQKPKPESVSTGQTRIQTPFPEDIPIPELLFDPQLRDFESELRKTCLQSKRIAQERWHREPPSQQELSTAQLTKELKLTELLFALLEKQPLQYVILSGRNHDRIRQWLSDLFDRLCSVGMKKSARTLYESMQRTIGEHAANQVCPTVAVVALTGSPIELSTYVERQLALGLADIPLLECCGTSLSMASLHPLAERASRRAFALAIEAHDPSALSASARTLIDVLIAAGKTDEAARISTMFAQNELYLRPPIDAIKPKKSEQTETPNHSPEPNREPRTATPKIARNAPCPCGSGNKYKKCCGLGTQIGVG